MIRLRPATVFLKLLTSWFLAPSPRYLCLSERETREGVARLEVSLTITSIPRLRATATTVLRLPKSIPTTDIFKVVLGSLNKRGV